MLSTKRSSEDHDLLERSTKKPNVDDGTTVLEDMEVAAELGDAQAEAAPDLGSVEVVAETPVADQGGVRIQGLNDGALDNGSEAPSAEVDAQEPGVHSKSVDVVKEATRRKSYLASVVGCWRDTVWAMDDRHPTGAETRCERRRGGEGTKTTIWNWRTGYGRCRIAFRTTRG
nr:hypothetical protein Iba_chr11fCG11350 [Ipomoea batatas]